MWTPEEKLERIAYLESLRNATPPKRPRSNSWLKPTLVGASPQQVQNSPSATTSSFARAQGHGSIHGDSQEQPHLTDGDTRLPQGTQRMSGDATTSQERIAEKPKPDVRPTQPTAMVIDHDDESMDVDSEDVRAEEHYHDIDMKKAIKTMFINAGPELVARDKPLVEAYHYPSWNTISNTHFGEHYLEGPDEVVTTVIAPQLPMGNVERLVAVASTTGDRKAKEQSYRVPDFSQISVKTQVSLAAPELEMAVNAYCEDVHGFIDHLGLDNCCLRCTLLVENKPAFRDVSCDWVTVTYRPQLKDQATFCFINWPDAEAIGGILAFGRQYTYCEFLRDEDLIETATTPLDKQGWRHPSEQRDIVKAQRERRIKFVEDGTELGKDLDRTFADGEMFLDATAPEGKVYLQKIAKRARELAPTYYKDVAE